MMWETQIGYAYGKYLALLQPDFKGVRNRARIRGDCEQIIDLLKKAQELGELDAEHDALSLKLSSPEYWSERHGG